MRLVRTALHLAEKVGARVERSEILQRPLPDEQGQDAARLNGAGSRDDLAILLRGVRGFETSFEKAAVFGDATADPFAPEAKAGGFQLAAHHGDDLTFHQPRALFDLLEAGAILPGEPDEMGNLIRRER